MTIQYISQLVLVFLSLTFCWLLPNIIYKENTLQQRNGHLLYSEIPLPTFYVLKLTLIWKNSNIKKQGVLSSTFVAAAKIIFCCKFGAPLITIYETT